MASSVVGFGGGKELMVRHTNSNEKQKEHTVVCLWVCVVQWFSVNFRGALCLCSMCLLSFVVEGEDAKDAGRRASSFFRDSFLPYLS